MTPFQKRINGLWVFGQEQSQIGRIEAKTIITEISWLVQEYILPLLHSAQYQTDNFWILVAERVRKHFILEIHWLN